MRDTRRLILVTLVLTVLVVLAVAAPAFAYKTNEKQYVPGTTTRVIWDKIQVAAYKLDNVTHRGYIHIELKFKPNWADFDVYLLNSSNASLAEPQGYGATMSGKEVADYYVRGVTNNEVKYDEYGNPYIEGDTYYVLVVAFNEKAQFQLWGYTPQIDMSADPIGDTTNVWNVWYQGWRKPTKASQWTWLTGPMYGGPYDFKPTSEGEVNLKLEWPADVSTGIVGNLPNVANMEHYLYAGSEWDTVLENYGHDPNFIPPLINQSPGIGDESPVVISETADVTQGMQGKPQKTYHYVPSLYEIAADPLLGPIAPPKTGVRSMGFKATVNYPQNLRLTSAPSSVKKGAKAVLKGTFALNGAVKASAKVSIQWQDPKTKNWKTKISVTTGADGKWSATVKPTKTLKWRAKATGDDATGLAIEYSLIKQIRVHL